MAAASGLLALTLLLVLAAFLALPLLQAPYAADEVQPLELLTEQRELVLRALAELELDHAAQKLDPADHAQQRALRLGYQLMHTCLHLSVAFSHTRDQKF